MSKRWLLSGDPTNPTKSPVLAQYSDVAYKILVGENNPIVSNLIELDVPDIDATKVGMTGTLYINPQSNDLWYEYVTTPLSPDELRDKRLSDLEIAIAQLLGQ